MCQTVKDQSFTIQLLKSVIFIPTLVLPTLPPCDTARCGYRFWKVKRLHEGDPRTILRG